MRGTVLQHPPLETVQAMGLMAVDVVQDGGHQMLADCEVMLEGNWGWTGPGYWCSSIIERGEKAVELIC